MTCSVAGVTGVAAAGADAVRTTVVTLRLAGRPGARLTAPFAGLLLPVPFVSGVSVLVPNSAPVSAAADVGAAACAASALDGDAGASAAAGADDAAGACAAADFGDAAAGAGAAAAAAAAEDACVSAAIMRSMISAFLALAGILMPRFLAMPFRSVTPNDSYISLVIELLSLLSDISNAAPNIIAANSLV